MQFSPGPYICIESVSKYFKEGKVYQCELSGNFLAMIDEENDPICVQFLRSTFSPAQVTNIPLEEML
jgi:hypothetical protein